MRRFSKGIYYVNVRPSLSPAGNQFSEINVNVQRVGEIIGGKVGLKVNMSVFLNSCQTDELFFACNQRRLEYQRKQ